MTGRDDDLVVAVPESAAFPLVAPKLPATYLVETWLELLTAKRGGVMVHGGLHHFVIDGYRVSTADHPDTLSEGGAWSILHRVLIKSLDGRDEPPAFPPVPIVRPMRPSRIE